MPNLTTIAQACGLVICPQCHACADCTCSLVALRSIVDHHPHSNTILFIFIFPQGDLLRESDQLVSEIRELGLYGKFPNQQ